MQASLFRLIPRVRLRPSWHWVGALGLLVMLLPSARAGSYLYPKEDPVFNVALPDGWTVTERPGPAQLLVCSPAGDGNYFVSLIRVPNVNNKGDLTTVLARIAQAGATGAGLTDVTVSPATETAIGPGARMYTRVSATGKHDGSDGAYTYYAFSLVAGGKYYALGTAGLQPTVDAHRAEFEKIALSIRALK